MLMKEKDIIIFKRYNNKNVNNLSPISKVTSLTCAPPVCVQLQEWSNIHLCVHVADVQCPLLSHDLQLKIKIIKNAKFYTNL